MKALLISILFFVVACGSIPQDTTTPPIDVNLFTLEMASCNKRDVGLLACENKQGGSLEVPLFHEGEYQIQSKECNFHQNKSYKGTQTLVIPYQALMAGLRENDSTCIFDLKVFINGLDKGLRGQFILANKRYKWAKISLFNQQFKGLGWVQLREGTELSNTIEVALEDKGIIFWEGCSISGEKKYQGITKIKLSEVFDGYLTESSSCTLNVGVIPDDNTRNVEFAKISLSIFGKTAVSLPEPVIYKDGKYLKIEADPVVAGIAIADKFKIKKGKRTKKFKSKVDHEKETYIRIMTANGRYMLFKVINGEVVWKNYVSW